MTEMTAATDNSLPYLIGSFALVLGVITTLVLLGLLGLAFLRTGSSWIDTHAQRRRVRRRAIQRTDLQTNLDDTRCCKDHHYTCCVGDDYPPMPCCAACPCAPGRQA